MDTGLQNRHAVVTGSSGGIGLEVTRVFLEEGARVTATYRTSERGLVDLQKKWQDALTLSRVDVRSESEIENLFLDAGKNYGRADILVANAGIANHEGTAVHAMSLDQWENTLAVNLTGSFLCVKHFFANLERHPGESASVILVGSTAGFFGEAWYCDYSTSKAGLHGLMMSLKNEIVHLS
ncbi:MAG: SDR family NAD(P)-dependent oxidoreductase, partial [Promethearchaeota archaeon]